MVCSGFDLWLCSGSLLSSPGGTACAASERAFSHLPYGKAKNKLREHPWRYVTGLAKTKRNKKGCNMKTRQK